MTVIRYDFVELKATVTPDGFIKDRPIITRSGIFNYRTADGKIRREYRPESEVFSEDSLGTLAGVPITDGHRGLVSAASLSGNVGTVLTPGQKEEKNVVAGIVIHQPALLGDRRDLSLGYTCNLDETPGVSPDGEPYDAIQKGIVYNHLAVVKKGRAGNARLRMDSADAASGSFETEDVMDVKLVPVRLDELEYQASPEVALALKKAQTDLEGLKKRYDSVEAERDTAKSELETQKTTFAAREKEIQAQSRQEIRARMDLDDVARKLEADPKDTDSDRLVREKVLAKLRPEMKFDGKSDDYVMSAFDTAVAYDAEKVKKVGEQRKASNQRQDSTPPKSGGSSEDARQRMINRIKGIKEQEAA